MLRTMSNLSGLPSATIGHRREPRHGFAGQGFLWNFFATINDHDSHDHRPKDVRRRTPKMARLEAVLFVADEAMPIRKLVQLATLADVDEAQDLIDRLNLAYDTTGSTFRIERVATGFRLLTRREFVFWLDKLHQRQAALKLTPPMLETLAIVAYRQPLTRADVELVRGVQSAEMLKQLMERELVRIAGEDDSLGRPYLYETTRKFMELFGLRSLGDLPMADRLCRDRALPADEIGSAA